MTVVGTGAEQSAVVAAEREAARRVAIRLSGLSVADRRWILERLEAGQRRAVEVAGAELQKILGNESIDFSLFFDDQVRPDKQQSSCAVSHAINSMDIEQLRVVLDRLPLVWVKGLMQSGIWNEGDKYLERLSAKHRQRLRKSAAAVLPPRVASALADSLVELTRVNGARHG